jgi:hypothetical protein
VARPGNRTGLNAPPKGLDLKRQNSTANCFGETIERFAL